MTFTEYINLPSIEHLSPFSVDILPEECESITKMNKGRVVVIRINNDYYSYFCDNESHYNCLYTMDKDGNMKDATTFKLKEDRKINKEDLINRKLIATAPEMYEALLVISDYFAKLRIKCTFSIQDEKIWKLISRVIDKMKGE